MKKGNILIIILSILLIATNIAWIVYYFQLPQEKQKGWVWNPDNGGNSWHGTETTKTTEAFRIIGEEWRISWSFTGYAQGARCDITVYDAYTQSEVKTLSLTYDKEEGYLNLTGRFYLTIRIYGSVDSWDIQVWEYR